MNKLLVVYNICGIRGNESSDYYIRAVDSILNQSMQDKQVLISACCVNVVTKNKLYQRFGNNINYVFIDSVYPVPVTFNYSCLAATKHHGEFDGYMYIDSGCIFTKSNDLDLFYKGYKSHPDCGMYAAQVDEDNGYHLWYNLGRYTDDHSEDYKLFVDGDFKIPVGKCCNLHAQIFSNDIVKYYGRPYTDIFAGHCSESVFYFICAALKKSYWISKDVILHHERLDGQSSGFDPAIWRQHHLSYDHPYLIPSIMQAVCSEEAYDLGMGFAEVSTPDHPNGVMNHQPHLYDDNGYAINPHLKQYIKKHLFLDKNYLDYDLIKGQFI